MLGLSWLVRPEMALVAALMLMVVILAPAPSDRLDPWLQRLVLVAVAGVLPVGYQIWRMGYYGLLSPNTAVSKGATGSNWSQGLTYLWNTVGPYWLWLPAAVLLVAALACGLAAAQATPAGPGAAVSPALLRQRLRSPRVGGDADAGVGRLPDRCTWSRSAATSCTAGSCCRRCSVCCCR